MSNSQKQDDAILFTFKLDLLCMALAITCTILLIQEIKIYL
ncbi:MAG: Uncharacterised protein [Opitutia bacterium UBA7350]|nr:MAG: Uncharacterised protein [Opitutae bacterium UBA7350]